MAARLWGTLYKLSEDELEELKEQLSSYEGWKLRSDNDERCEFFDMYGDIETVYKVEGIVQRFPHAFLIKESYLPRPSD